MNKTTIKNLTNDDLQWKDGTPVSPQFDDVYFSKDDGMAETDFVFLKGVGLDHMLRAQTSKTDCLTIAETGFGTGLNFLMTWQRFREINPCGRLLFISVEAYPLSEHALETAHAHFPALTELSQNLRSRWPAPSPGFHLRHFDQGRVSLLLLFGDIKEILPKLDVTHCRGVDAWYLDGFAPSKNPDMWHDDVFKAMADKSAVGAKLATFTAAGFVRRGLQAQGFHMQKTDGFGRKRECLVGEFKGVDINSPDPQGDETYLSKEDDQTLQTHHQIPEKNEKPQTVAVIGAGFAGAFTAYTLKKAGIDITVISTDDRHMASKVPTAILAPRFQLDDSPAAEFFTSAYGYSLHHPAFKSAQYGKDGVFQHAKTKTDATRLTKLAAHLNWPKDWLSLEGNGISHPKSASFHSETLRENLLDDIPRITGNLQTLEQEDNLWALKDYNGQIIGRYDSVILCTGVETNSLEGLSALNIRPNKGQVITVSDPEQLLPRQDQAYGGYLCAGDMKTRPPVLGSTFEKNPDVDAPLTASQTATDYILSQAAAYLDIDPSRLSVTDYFVGLRATTADHLPLCGPLPNFEQWRQALKPLAKDAKAAPNAPLEYQNGLYILSGLGSKGLQYAPLCAAYIASMVAETASPIPKAIQKNLCPGRFLKRQIIKGKT